jgi:hypothetical protein
LYQDILSGNYHVTLKGEIITAQKLKETASEAQTPELFDFYATGGNIVLRDKAVPGSTVAVSAH